MIFKIMSVIMVLIIIGAISIVTFTIKSREIKLYHAIVLAILLLISLSDYTFDGYQSWSKDLELELLRKEHTLAIDNLKSELMQRNKVDNNIDDLKVEINKLKHDYQRVSRIEKVLKYIKFYLALVPLSILLLAEYMERIGYNNISYMLVRFSIWSIIIGLSILIGYDLYYMIS
ncbi:MAG TPA: hypothetical protein PKA10_13940 [Selenomonadales bacterium]|nr:hypothetical protein [Selenomonadales bacterium]